MAINVQKSVRFASPNMKPFLFSSALKKKKALDSFRLTVGMCLKPIVLITGLCNLRRTKKESQCLLNSRNALNASNI